MHNGFRFASSNWIIALRSTAIVLVAWNHGQAYGHVLSAISRSPFLVRSCFVDATCDPVSFADFIHGSIHKRAHVLCVREGSFCQFDFTQLYAI